MRIFLKALAWIGMIGGLIAHPIVYGLSIIHHVQPAFVKYEGYLVLQDVYLMVFGMIGSITGGAALLILLDIQTHVRADSNATKKF